MKRKRSSSWTPFHQDILFAAGVVGTGLLIGFLNRPDEWYMTLSKPSFTPPAWVFAPTWSILYAMVAVAGSQTFRSQPTGLPMILWFWQIALNFSWSPIFFTFHDVRMAFVVIVALWFVIVSFVVVQWNRQRSAALLFLPYAAWVTFAATLNLAIAGLNNA